MSPVITLSMPLKLFKLSLLGSNRTNILNSVIKHPLTLIDNGHPIILIEFARSISEIRANCAYSCIPEDTFLKEYDNCIRTMQYQPSTGFMLSFNGGDFMFTRHPGYIAGPTHRESLQRIVGCGTYTGKDTAFAQRELDYFDSLQQVQKVLRSDKV